MPIIVTGGNGFIGSNFIDYMLSGGRTNKIVNIDKRTPISSDWISKKWMSSPNYEEYQHDISDFDKFFVDPGAIDHLVHFAAESHVDNSLGDINPFISTNVNGTLAVARFCHKHKIRMIHISTDEVYGHIVSVNEKPFNVDDPLKPRNPYAASKASAELMLEAFANTVDGFEYMIVRPSNNYGPHQDNTKLIPKMIECISNETALPIYEYGDFYREWTHVSDTVEILYKIIQYTFISGEKINISSKELMSNIDMYKYVLNMFRKYVPSTIGKIDFIPDPRGNAHDKAYAIVNTLKHDFIDIIDGIEDLVKMELKLEDG